MSNPILPSNSLPRVAIVGASGYGGGELARLLDRHPSVHVVQAITDTYANRPLADAFPGLAHTKVGRLTCTGKSAVIDADIVFLAQENGYAMTVAHELLAAGRLVIDLSADFRLLDPNIYRRYYKIEPAAESLRAKAVYGLPERKAASRESLRGARLIANPGCHVTAATLALAPLLDNGLIETRGIIVDSKTGISGAGRSKSDTIFRFSEADGAVRPYGVGGVHRHIPEIEQNLGGAPVTFTPHLVPMPRGIISTCYAPTKDGVTTESLIAALHAAYADEPFVVVRDAHDWPSTKDTLGSNAVHVTAVVDERTNTAIAVGVLDNLMKGAAGAAVQNMNLALGIDETLGLEGAGLWP